jgi:hypothetical protein
MNKEPAGKKAPRWLQQRPASRRERRLVLGGVYFNPQATRIISVQFLGGRDQGDAAGYEIESSRGIKRVIDGTVGQLREMIKNGGFALDHVDMGC